MSCTIEVPGGKDLEGLWRWYINILVTIKILDILTCYYYIILFKAQLSASQETYYVSATSLTG
jgi:hypothetical protein